MVLSCQGLLLPEIIVGLGFPAGCSTQLSGAWLSVTAMDLVVIAHCSNLAWFVPRICWSFHAFVALSFLHPTYWNYLTLILLTWNIGWAPTNASKCQMGFNSAFKGLNRDIALLHEQIGVPCSTYQRWYPHDFNLSFASVYHSSVWLFSRVFRPEFYYQQRSIRYEKQI
jgi:hypothetical protein